MNRFMNKYLNFKIYTPFPMQKTPLLIVLLCLSFAPSATSQDSDSLTAALDTAQGPAKVKTLNELFRSNLMSDPVKALTYTREALTLATEIGDERGMAASYNNLGVAYRNQGALDKALEYYLTSLRLYTALNNKDGIATTKNNIANIYLIKKDHGQAMRYLEESYDLIKELGDEIKVIGSMNNLGNLYSDMQMYDKADQYYQQAFDLSEKAGEKFSDPLINLGNIQFRQGSYQRAVEFYEKALAIERANNNRLAILNILTNLGITYTKAKQPRKAQPYLEEATELSHALQAFTVLPTIYKAAAENYSHQGKWKDAYKTQLKYDEQREKIYGEESSRNIAQMEMVVAFQEKEREIDLLKKEDEIKSLELYNSRLFIILVILGIFFILALFNLFYLDRKKKLINP